MSVLTGIIHVVTGDNIHAAQDEFLILIMRGAIRA